MYKTFTSNGKWKSFAHKILLIMRLTTVIIIASMLQVSASTFAQRVTLKGNAITLKQIFSDLKKQTGYTVIYSNAGINDKITVDANFDKTAVEDVIKAVLNGHPISYTLKDKAVILSRKEKTVLDKILDVFDNIDVSGRLVDKDGNAISGATITVKGTNRTVVSGSTGFFSLSSVDEKAILKISYVGFTPLEIPVQKNLGAIVLTSADSKLEEVKINAGYYTITDRERTGSIAKVTGEEISRNPVDNPLIALVGRVPGLQINQSNGNPGGGFTVRVRGQNSLNSGNDPLYVIDGVTFPSAGISSLSGSINANLGIGGANPLASINPSDIESLEVLKDADATAIYGSRGANGVILITTKRGKQSATTVNANVSHGYSEVGHKVDLLNTTEYLQMRREAYFNNDKLTTSSPEYGYQYDINGTWDENRYTDWQKKLIGRSAARTNANLDISGGSEKSNYLFGGNYLNEETVTPGGFGYKRYGLHSNVNLGGNEERFNASLTINLSRTESNLSLNSNSITGILTPPNAPEPYDQYGKLNWSNGTFGFNPLVSTLLPSKSITENLITNLNLNIKLLNNLIFKTSFGYNTIKRNEFRKQPLAAFDPAEGATSATRRSYFGNIYNNSLIIEPQINYYANMAGGKVTALIGASLQHTDSQINVINASNFTSDDLLENMASALTLSNPENTFIQYRYEALYGRLNYSLSEKYFFNLTARRDGSSRFGPGKQFANFGAVGVAWIFSDEQYMKELIPFLSFGKLRASYGITGNDQIQDYRYLQLWNSNTAYAGTSTFIPNSAAPNADFAWETNRKLEAATQVGFIKDNLNLEFAWFRNRSSNQLIFQSLPLSTGQGGAYVNLPAEVQNTGWEINATVKLLKGRHFNWLMAFNISMPKNKLMSYDGLEKSVDANKYVIGEPLNILKTYNAMVDTQTGSYNIEDKNGNGATDLADRYLVKFLGQKYYGGFKNSFRYKQFNLDILFSFSKQLGTSYMNGSALPGDFAFGQYTNQFSQVLKRWQNPGDKTGIAKYSTTFDSFLTYLDVSNMSNASIVDASYIRLRNVSFSYDLSPGLLSPLKISKAALYIQGQNIFTITKYIGLDPETGGITLPPLRTITIGLNFTF